ncbi:MAG: DNA-protecting protein DprA [Coriobacteriia bacterium]|nr:DNA-protecting protein DprA [Coriobacteriia bacterium]
MGVTTLREQQARAQARKQVPTQTDLPGPRPCFELETTDEFYPRQLLDYEQAPEVIYGRGQASTLRPGVAIIGARNATPYGISAARAVATWAVARGLAVYSGCARGCDQAAHRGALEAGGSTVAVLGCGADVAYPNRAAGLLDEITGAGCVVSKYAWGTPPAAYRFRERNWLIAALSQLVVVVEARIPSGTFSTVEHALDLGVGLAAVPGSIFCPESQAPNRFIGEGAIPLTCQGDLDSAIERFLPIEVQERIPGDPEAGSSAGETCQLALPVATDDQLLRILAAQPTGLEELARELSLSPREAMLRCSRAEIEGVVERYPDGRYGLSSAELLRRAKVCSIHERSKA